ncbi:hypothetical protein II906_11220 [bacterium]|nr:hypothetical protein [bacterium]
MINSSNKIQVVNKTAEQNIGKQQSFKGPGTALLSGLRGINTSPAIGACAVDLCSMVLPRTFIEFKNRGVQSGIEAGIREGSGCALHANVGLIGLGAAALLSQGFNKAHGIKAHNIFASGDTIRNYAQVWQKSADKTEFFQGILSSIKGLNGSEWKSLSQDAVNEISENLSELASKTTELAGKNGAAKATLKKEIAALKKLVAGKITQNTGAQSAFKIDELRDASGKFINREINIGVNELVDNAVSVSNAFATKTKEELPKFVKKLTSNKTASTLLGLAVCCAIGASVQPLNKWLTKKRTGKDGFVGVKDKKAETSKGFKMARTAAGIGFPLFAISTIGNPKNLLNAVQFNSMIPSLNQFKLIYGMTIGSRLLAARDGNELREAGIKDFLGFTNWLIFGGMVSKLTARAIGGKGLINNPVARDKSKTALGYAANWLMKASVKTVDEVLLPNAKNISKGDKLLKFKELYQKASPEIKKQVQKIGLAQVAGYLYSGLVLGVGIAKLNIFITKKLQDKKQTKDMTENTLEKPRKIDLAYLAEKNIQNSVFKDFK